MGEIAERRRFIRHVPENNRCRAVTSSCACAQRLSRGKKSHDLAAQVTRPIKMADAWRLDTLPSDVLLLIFDYCHAFDLVRLSKVCTRFHEIIRARRLWIKKSKLPLVTNQTSKRFRERCRPILSLRTKWHVSHNWQCGKYQETIVISLRTKVMPWMQLTKQFLWWSGRNHLYRFKRNTKCQDYQQILGPNGTTSDICKFVVRDSSIVTGHRDGTIKRGLQSNGRFYLNINRAHSCDVNALDAMPNVIISGSADGTVKIWRHDGVPIPEIEIIPSATINVGDRIWSMAIDPIGSKFAVGTSGIGPGPALHIFDFERYSERQPLNHNFRRGAGVLDMVWDNPNILLSGGYDTYIRKWDLRTGRCVMKWSDPTDATLYSISSDYQYTMVTGTQFDCKSVLWDQRQKHYVQLYFMSSRRMSSPVYSVQFDSSHLYGATDQHIVELDFSGYSNKENNYREVLRYD